MSWTTFPVRSFRLDLFLKIDFRVEYVLPLYNTRPKVVCTLLHTPQQPKRYIRSLNVWLLLPRRIGKLAFSFFFFLIYRLYHFVSYYCIATDAPVSLSRTLYHPISDSLKPLIRVFVNFPNTVIYYYYYY